MNKQKTFNKICKDIKTIKIQGAENIAKKALYAYKLIPKESSKRKLISLRPTEPMLQNILRIADKISYRELEEKLNDNQEKINKNAFKLIRNNSIIFTHCHSSTVARALIYAKKNGKRFEVYNTETRPLFQGRRTAQELKKANINVTTFVDSAMKIALTKDQDKEEKTKPVNLILIGTDAITKKGIINKVGSGILADIAKRNHIPFYIVTDSLKFTKKQLKLEQRNRDEVWRTKKESETNKIKIKNPAFEFIPRKKITGIISELGILKYNNFLRKVN